jgi:hypothetical protein
MRAALGDPAVMALGLDPFLLMPGSQGIAPSRASDSNSIATPELIFAKNDISKVAF